MANLTYRQATQVAPSSTTTKNAPLTSAEIDGNLKSINDELALKAPLASPTLTGTPVAPTATAGTNTTQIATTAFVIAERSNTATLTNKTLALGSNSVSGTLAQFNTACSDADFAYTGGALDQFASTTSAQLAGVISDETGSGALVFADSPALTGTPTAPTPAQFDNDTSLATTAFVKTAGFQFSGAGSIVASRNLLASDIGNLLINEAAGGTNTFTILSPEAVGARIGDTFSCMNYGSNGLNLAFSGCTYVYGAAGQTAGFSVGTGEWITFVAESSNSWGVVNATAGMKNIESFRSSLNSNGYQKLPSGLIIQWIFTLTTANAGAPNAGAAFPVSFPNACVSLQGSIVQATGSTMSVWFDGGLQKNATPNFRCSGLIGSAVLFFAVGY